jgi:magnesium-transporting ATPase (P-type)
MEFCTKYSYKSKTTMKTCHFDLLGFILTNEFCQCIALINIILHNKVKETLSESLKEADFDEIAGVAKKRAQKTSLRILGMCPFSSARKRMSVLFEFQGEIWLFCKGADSVIRERSVDNTDPEKMKYVDEAVARFANEGMRILWHEISET